MIGKLPGHDTAGSVEVNGCAGFMLRPARHIKAWQPIRRCISEALQKKVMLVKQGQPHYQEYCHNLDRLRHASVAASWQWSQQWVCEESKAFAACMPLCRFLRPDRFCSMNPLGIADLENGVLISRLGSQIIKPGLG